MVNFSSILNHFANLVIYNLFATSDWNIMSFSFCYESRLISLTNFCHYNGIRKKKFLRFAISRNHLWHLIACREVLYAQEKYWRWNVTCLYFHIPRTIAIFDVSVSLRFAICLIYSGWPRADLAWNFASADWVCKVQRVSVLVEEAELLDRACWSLDNELLSRLLEYRRRGVSADGLEPAGLNSTSLPRDCLEFSYAAKDDLRIIVKLIIIYRTVNLIRCLIIWDTELGCVINGMN